MRSFADLRDWAWAASNGAATADAARKCRRVVDILLEYRSGRIPAKISRYFVDDSVVVVVLDGVLSAGFESLFVSDFDSFLDSLLDEDELDLA